MGHLRSICDPFALHLRSGQFLVDCVGPVFFDLEQRIIICEICLDVSVALDYIVHSPMLYDDHAVLKNKDKPLCNQEFQIVDACPDVLRDPLRVPDESVVVRPHAKVEI